MQKGTRSTFEQGRPPPPLASFPVDVSFVGRGDRSSMKKRAILRPVILALVPLFASNFVFCRGERKSRWCRCPRLLKTDQLGLSHTVLFSHDGRFRLHFAHTTGTAPSFRARFLSLHMYVWKQLPPTSHYYKYTEVASPQSRTKLKACRTNWCCSA